MHSGGGKCPINLVQLFRRTGPFSFLETASLADQEWPELNATAGSPAPHGPRPVAQVRVSAPEPRFGAAAMPKSPTTEPLAPALAPPARTSARASSTASPPRRTIVLDLEQVAAGLEGLRRARRQEHWGRDSKCPCDSDCREHVAARKADVIVVTVMQHLSDDCLKLVKDHASPLWLGFPERQRHETPQRVSLPAPLPSCRVAQERESLRPDYGHGGRALTRCRKDATSRSASDANRTVAGVRKLAL
jgi:hypothetical protein